MAINDARHSDVAYKFELLSVDWPDECHEASKGREKVPSIISTRPMFEALIEDILQRRPASEISAKFHNGLVKVFVQLAHAIRGGTSLSRVCLSGGTFNNAYLTTHLSSELRAADFEVFTQNDLPAGDGGLALGQAMVAAHCG